MFRQISIVNIQACRWYTSQYRCIHMHTSRDIRISFESMKLLNKHAPHHLPLLWNRRFMVSIRFHSRSGSSHPTTKYSPCFYLITARSYESTFDIFGGALPSDCYLEKLNIRRVHSGHIMLVGNRRVVLFSKHPRSKHARWLCFDAINRTTRVLVL